jgi:cellulose synthase/poly-beta-1,6-N-acetylglucosamine synthase-like glycosyltransferase
MSTTDITFLLVYAVAILMLIFFGLHKYFLLYLHAKYKDRPILQSSKPGELPTVTVQLPLFNERYVVERLIRAVCALQYPKELLEIQVLDDSTDDTTEVARALVSDFASSGYDIVYLHRHNRRGFKAGALDAGLRTAKGDLVAIFDADFVPTPDFLTRTVGYFETAKIGMVQTRWGHINRNYSLLTRVQSIFLDGHFVIEHLARNRSGRFFNFNGTAGIWRKQAIYDAGGWQHDTLTEDLDLSYRAQIEGWQFIYVPDLVSPAELPVEMNAYKSQQHRWAKGSVQTAKKLIPRIIRSKLPLFVKFEAILHLFSNFTYLFMTIPSLLVPVILYIQVSKGWDWMVYLYFLVFISTSLSVVVYYLIAQRESYPGWRGQILYLPALMSIGIGLSLNNSRAVLEGLFNRRSEFKRTPKYRIEGRNDQWHEKEYRTELRVQPLLEIGVGLYFTSVLTLLLTKGYFISIPFFLLFQFGFFYVGLTSVLQSMGTGIKTNTSQLARRSSIPLVAKKPVLKSLDI